mmetsp:Transcript_1869/g.5448  ORF Transcript_1869/g.5448 Transcript_1869/m.5448 type:complete len:129 (-) Transcript_1869:93-479(-)
MQLAVGKGLTPRLKRSPFSLMNFSLRAATSSGSRRQTHAIMAAGSLCMCRGGLYLKPVVGAWADCEGGLVVCQALQDCRVLQRPHTMVYTLHFEHIQGLGDPRGWSLFTRVGAQPQPGLPGSSKDVLK